MQEKNFELAIPEYTETIYSPIFDQFQNLEYFKIVLLPFPSLFGSRILLNKDYPIGQLDALPSTFLVSSTIRELHIKVVYFPDVICVLDGRFKHLSRLFIECRIGCGKTSILPNKVNLSLRILDNDH